MNPRIAAAAIAATLLASSASPLRADAGTPHHHGEAERGASGTDGSPGKASAADRTVRIEARDTAFNVKQIQVRAGETVRFVITNRGELRHEFVIASSAEHAEHRAMMRQMPDMAQDESNAVSIEPGQTKALVWKFGKDTDVEFACDIPGHAEQGMAGGFRVVR